MKSLYKLLLLISLFVFCISCNQKEELVATSTASQSNVIASDENEDLSSTLEISQEGNGDEKVTPTPIVDQEDKVEEVITPSSNLDADFEWNEKFDIHSTNLISSNTGGRYIGIIKNISDTPQTEIIMKLTINDDNNKVIYETTTTSFLSLVLPNEESPFEFDITSELLLSELNFQIDIIESSSVQSFKTDLIIKNQNLIVDDLNLTHYLFELTHNEETPIEVFEIASAVYDSNNTLVNVNFDGLLKLHILPETGNAYRITFPEEITQSINTVMIFTAYRPVEDPGSFSIANSTESNPKSFTDLTGSYHIVGEVINIGNEPVSLWLKATLFDQDNNPIDYSYYSNPGFVVESGNILQYDFNNFEVVDRSLEARNKVSYYTIEVDPASSSISNLSPVWLDTSDVRVLRLNNYLQISGKIENDSGTDLSNLSAIITIMDDEGNLVGTSNLTMYEIFENGKVKDFSVFASTETVEQYEDFIVDIKVQGFGDNS